MNVLPRWGKLRFICVVCYQPYARWGQVEEFICVVCSTRRFTPMGQVGIYLCRFVTSLGDGAGLGIYLCRFVTNLGSLLRWGNSKALFVSFVTNLMPRWGKLRELAWNITKRYSNRALYE